MGAFLYGCHRMYINDMYMKWIAILWQWMLYVFRVCVYTILYTFFVARSLDRPSSVRPQRLSAMKRNEQIKDVRQTT